MTDYWDEKMYDEDVYDNGKGILHIHLKYKTWSLWYFKMWEEKEENKNKVIYNVAIGEKYVIYLYDFKKSSTKIKIDGLI